MIELMVDLELGVTKRTINVVDRSFFEKFEKGSH